MTHLALRRNLIYNVAPFLLVLLLVDMVNCYTAEGSHEPTNISNQEGTGMRQCISLNGQWEFKLDPNNVGLDQYWYRSDQAYPMTITVPGAWDAQGIGDETDKMHHNYVGKAWYRKKVYLQEPAADSLVWLKIGGVHRYAKAWINGNYLGEHLLYPTPFKFNISEYVIPEHENVIAIQVDNDHRTDIDALLGTFDTIDYMFIQWGGIYRNVELEHTSKSYIADVFIRPDIDKSRVALQVRLLSQLPTGHFQLECSIEDHDTSISVKEDIELRPGENSISLAVDLKEPILWSPEDPHLYRAKLTLLHDDKRLDRIEERFGMKKLEVRGKDFYLNNRPYYMRGYGDDTVHPITLCPPIDKEENLAFFQLVKSFGFNYVRYHSFFPFEEILDAADEAGILVQTGYLGYVHEETAAAKALLLQEWGELITLSRNHPSIMAYSARNEAEEFDYDREMYSIAKRCDPDRLAIMSDGVLHDKDTHDFITGHFPVDRLPYAEHADMYAYSGYQKPLIIHESGNYTTLYNMYDQDRFTGAVKPFWLLKFREAYDRKKIDPDDYQLYLNNSFHIQRLCHKTDLEAARRSKDLRGYHVWTITDYYCANQGLLSMFKEVKGIDPSEYRTFNDETVVLWDNCNNRCYAWTDNFTMDLVLSKYDERPIVSGVLDVRLKDERGAIISRVVEDNIVLEGYGVIPIRSCRLPLPPVSSPVKLIVETRLQDATHTLFNHWAIWVFPTEFGINPHKESIFISESLRYLQAHGFQSCDSITNAAVAITDVLDQDTLDLLEDGGNVFLMIPFSNLLENTIEGSMFRLGWYFIEESDQGWGLVNNRKRSNVIEDHPLWGDFPHDGFADLQFYQLINGVNCIDNESWPFDIQPIMYDVGVELNKIGFAFELRVGRGHLLVSTLNFSETIYHNHIEVKYLLAKFIEYLSGNHDHEGTSITVADLKRQIRE